ncbi:hypothetical protein CDAR_206851 [Caerostris darwini]|uniref:Uncharacterized protein n=1 Tax=Caerostris darwini TaxID=1538125 RepID=A0AAV4T5T2_9ARAC|nr:hypothetical protein CDAR_206851 [Caerostris darwini]
MRTTLADFQMAGKVPLERRLLSSWVNQVLLPRNSSFTISPGMPSIPVAFLGPRQGKSIYSPSGPRTCGTSGRSCDSNPSLYKLNRKKLKIWAKLLQSEPRISHLPQNNAST